ncbi:MAG: hypothetical protein E4H09_02140, partial [Spirochaetales bacterium]
MKRPAVRIVVQLLVIVGLIAAGIVVLGPVRAELARRIDVVKDEAVLQLEGYLGRHITYTSISPSVLRYVSIHGLAIHGRSGEPADLLTVESVRVYYRPLKILQGDYAQAFSQVRIENTVLNLDARMDADLTALVSDVVGVRQGSETEYALPQDLTVVGRNLTLAVATELGRVEMTRVFFDASLNDEIVSVRTEGIVTVSDVPESLPISTLSGRIQANGTINARTGDTLL